MYDPLILIISAIILVETSVLLLRKKPSFRGERMILVDTSVLIDGRILDIAGTGFVPGRLVIPRSVLGELQLLADGSDHEKRQRARNGLEAITKLQQIPSINLEIYRDGSEAREGVDNRLLSIARRLGYELCTVDYNLQKVAQAEGITTLSINELSQTLRTLYLPGEKLDLTLKQKGQEKGQAIGYASDGTMVVVDNADRLLDTTVGVEIVRSLQTNSGKMMFARLVKDKDQPSRPQRTPGSRSEQRTPRDTHDRQRGGNQQAGRAASSHDTATSRQPERRTDPQAAETVADTTDQQTPSTQNRNRNRRGGRRSGPKSAEDDLLNLVNNQQR